MIEILVIYNAKLDVVFSKACTPVAIAETAQSGGSSESIPEEVDQAFSGLPQSTPLKSRFDHEHLKMVLTSPAETVPRTKPSTSGTYLALPPTWTHRYAQILILFSHILSD